MTQFSGWVGAGVLTAGVSAALLVGAGAANADSDGGSDPGPAKTSSADSGKSSAATANRRHQKRVSDAPAGPQSRKSSAKRGDRPSGAIPRHRPAAEKTDDTAETPISRTLTASAPVHRLAVLRNEVRDRLAPSTADPQRAPVVGSHRAQAVIAQVADKVSTPTADQTSPSPTSILGPFQPDYPPLVRAVGSLVFNAIGGLIQTVDGPPVVPPALRDSVQVSSSTLVVAPGTEVPADWYIPTQGGSERLIYLQHGVLATGPMYSYTASYLAERTNSVVVVTTVTSNPFADGGMWLGGDNMHKAVAQLFLDPDRKALNASMTTATLKAGQESFAVPQQFVLVGHSLGGGFAPGVAGYYAEGLVARRADGQDVANDLAGVVLLDAVPVSPIMPNAMERLALLEASNGNDPSDYVPVYEIGAPPNFLNSTSSVNDDLSAARPGKFNGVVVDGGVHMDSMLGGNPLIQFAAYLVAGIPQPQNPPAVQWLMAGWINDMFEGNIDPVTGQCSSDCNGSYGAPGASIDIDGDHGNATGVVIESGSLPDESSWSAPRFIPVDASFIPRSVLSRSV